MDWTKSGSRPGAQHPGVAGSPSAPTQNSANKLSVAGGLKWASMALVVCGGVLLLALVAFMVFGGRKAESQGKFVDTSKMQAVFLNGGQVYFGKIKSINDKALSMSDIYYLRVNQQVQPNGQAQANNDISLVKLGCELHGPQDQMVINQSQVIFWENLKDDGQVAKAVAEYVKQNPNGQKCDTSTQSNNNTNASTNAQSTTPSTNTSTKKQ